MVLSVGELLPVDQIQITEMQVVNLEAFGLGKTVCGQFQKFLREKKKQKTYSHEAREFTLGD